MNREPVESSTVSSIGYDATTAVLEVEFHSGGLYQYSQVPSDVHARLLAAKSIGSYLNTVIKKGGYLCTRLK